MDEDRVRELWSETLGPDTVLATVRPEQSYRPRQFATPIGTLSEGYTEIEQVGAGGMGVVLRARQEKLARDVALKRLRPGGDRELFLAEALLTGRLEHPGIVPIYDLGQGPLPFLAMRMVEGHTWQSVLASAAPRANIETLIQVCNAVAFAHSRGVVHNDIKPTNVMLGEFGEVLLLDWGLAVEYCDDPAAARIRHKSAFTSPGGTPSYMAPELALGDGLALGPWTDVYLLGATLYELLTGVPPRMGKSMVSIAMEAVEGTLPDLSEVPEELRPLCARAMSSEPQQRGSVAAFQAELRDYLRHAESRRIARDAAQTLAACQQESSLADEQGRSLMYGAYAEAAAGFRDALKIWPANPLAQDGVERARLGLAEAALRNGDLRMAEDQLARVEAEVAVALREQVQSARQRQERALQSRQKLRRGLAGTLLMVFVLLSGATAWLWQLNSALHESNQVVVSQFDVAARNLDRLTLAVREKLLLHAGDARSRQAARDVLAEALQGWQELAAIGTDEAASARGLAQVYLRTGELRFLIEKDLPGAERDLTRALELLQGQGETPHGFGTVSEVVRLLCEVRGAEGDWQQSLTMARASQARFAERLASDPEDTLLSFICATFHSLAGDINHRLGQYSAAGAEYSASQVLLSSLVERGMPLQRDLAAALLGLSGSLIARGEVATTQAHLLRAEELVSSSSDSTASVLILDLRSAINERLADVAMALQRPEEAVLRRRTALAIQESLRARDPDSPLFGRSLVSAKIGLADLLEALQDPEAEALWDEAVELTESSWERFPAGNESLFLLVKALLGRGVFHLYARRFSQAASDLERGSALLAGRTLPLYGEPIELAVAIQLELAACARKQGRLQVARAAVEDALELFAQRGDQRHGRYLHVKALLEKAEVALARGEIASAVEFGGAVTSLARQDGNCEEQHHTEPPELLFVLLRQAGFLAANGDPSSAHDALDELDSLLEPVPSSWKDSVRLQRLLSSRYTQRAMVLQAEDRMAEAHARLVDGISIAKQQHAQRKPGVRDNELLAEAHGLAAPIAYLLGQPEQALAHADVSLALYERLPGYKSERAKLLEHRGMIRIELGGTGLEDFEAALALDPTLPISAWQRGYYRILAGDARGAIVDLSHAIAGGFAAQLERGVAHAMLAEHDLACADFATCTGERAVWGAIWRAALGDDSALSQVEAEGLPGAVLEFARGTVSEQAFLTQATSFGLQQRAQALGFIGMFAERRGATEAAVEAYRACLEAGAKPDFQQTWSRLRLAVLAPSEP